MSATTAHDARTATTATTRWPAIEVRVLAAAILASGMAFVDATGVNVVLPALQAGFGATGPDLLWVVTAYSLPVATLLLPGGALGDRIGRRRLFMMGIASFGAASVACGLAPSVAWLIAFRVGQGLAAAFMIPGSLSLIAATVAPERRGSAIGWWSACSVVMTALGPVAGGALAGAGFWRGLFFINVPLAIGALVILRRPLHEVLDGERPGRVDAGGAACSVAGLAGIHFGLIRAAEHGFANPAVVVALGLGVIGLALLVVAERRAAAPMLPLQLFRRPAFAAACVLTLTFYSCLYGLLFWLSINLIQVQGYTPMQAGLAQLPVMLPILALAPIAGRRHDRHGPRGLLLIGPIVAGAGFLLLARPGATGGPGDFWSEFLPALAAIGTALGLTVAPLSATVVSSVPREHAGFAAGINSALSRLASVLGAAVLGPIVLCVFAETLLDRGHDLPVSGDVQESLSAEAVKLAAAEPPAGVPVEVAEQLREAIRGSFLRAFRTIACLCAAAVWLAAAVAAVLLRRSLPEESAG